MFKPCRIQIVLNLTISAPDIQYFFSAVIAQQTYDQLLQSLIILQPIKSLALRLYISVLPVLNGAVIIGAIVLITAPL